MLSGGLTIQAFPGPPNYEGVAHGDVEERVFILALPKAMCADDGLFIDATTGFDRVQVSAADDEVAGALVSAVGRRVALEGTAFGAHTAHHHAPLLLLADKVSVLD
ncbi:DUF4431 domain-containing protein [Phenylobacterium sp. J367]|uniref:DUF4431 domain-containing protein n=1 Tax=Phenylobacterium sp. J367 TaxID=2898435 RepID=UPI00215188DB|nr:DUF4431 domain-containing protein [Phenylobacterium sp. J367]MCR5877824.1 DUF4431 domain-containing protein [Phenylobacterium sp. J367]